MLLQVGCLQTLFGWEGRKKTSPPNPLKEELIMGYL
jgi:hypothetical protein